MPRVARSGTARADSTAAAAANPSPALAHFAGSASNAETVIPARARVAAMPGPMVPKPMTAAFCISGCDAKRARSGFRLLVGDPGSDLVAPGSDARNRRKRDGEAQAAIDNGSHANIG